MVLITSRASQGIPLFTTQVHDSHGTSSPGSVLMFYKDFSRDESSHWFSWGSFPYFFMISVISTISSLISHSLYHIGNSLTQLVWCLNRQSPWRTSVEIWLYPTASVNFVPYWKPIGCPLSPTTIDKISVFIYIVSFRWAHWKYGLRIVFSQVFYLW